WCRRSSTSATRSTSRLPPRGSRPGRRGTSQRSSAATSRRASTPAAPSPTPSWPSGCTAPGRRSRSSPPEGDVQLALRAGLARAARLPERLVRAGGRVRAAGEDEEQVGEPVQVDRNERADVVAGGGGQAVPV